MVRAARTPFCSFSPTNTWISTEPASPARQQAPGERGDVAQSGGASKLLHRKNAYDCIKAFSETDFTDDLKKFDIPTLIVHGDDDQIVPIDAAARAAAKLIRGATLKVYPGAPHGITDTHKEQLNGDLLEFLRT